MKRKSVKSLLGAALVALTLSMTACGGSDDGAASQAAVVEAETPAEEEVSDGEEASAEEEASPEEASVEEEAPAEEEASGAATLEDYLAGDAETAKQLEEQAQTMGNENMDMAIEVNGNDLVYVATLKQEVENPDDLASSIEEAVGPTYSALAGMMDGVIGAEKGTVSFGIRYCAPDGTVIAESSFRAE